MSVKRYMVAYDHGSARGELAVWSAEGEKAALETARRELRRQRLPQIASEGRLRIVGSRALGSRASNPAPLDRDERDVLAQLEIAGAGWKYFESDGDAYEAALRLVQRGLVKRLASGQTETRPVRKWIEIAVTKQGLLAAANRAPDEIVVLVTAAPYPGVREMVVRVDGFEGVLAVHPSLRNSHEIELATEGKPQSWGITHVPSGQLVATVSSLPWARRLAKEITAFADEGITSTDPRVAALAIGGPGMMRARYIGDVSRQARSRRGTFPTFAAWRKTAGVPSDPPRTNNPRTYSFIRHDETPTLVLGQIGWPQIWKYRGAEIGIRAWPGGAATATVVSPSLNWANRTIHTLDVNATLRAAKYMIDLAHAAKQEPYLATMFNIINDEANVLKMQHIPVTRQTLARAVTAGTQADLDDVPVLRAREWFENKSVAFRLELIDFMIEFRALQGIDPWPQSNPRRPNPDDIAGQAAVAAAMGALIGGVIGAAAGIVIFGAAGMALGAMASSTTGATTGLAIGAVFGIPLGAYIGTIWGAVRQTGRAMAGRPARRAKVLAGIGAAVTGPLAPVGAAVGAYLGAPGA